jgi:CP family cyanate transporter-like MFS transporter
VIALGLGPGTFPLVLTLVGLRTATHEAAAALAGFTQGIGYVIAALGPFVVGLLNDLQDSWSGALTFLLSGLVLQVIAGVVVGRTKNLEDELSRARRGAAEPASERSSKG